VANNKDKFIWNIEDIVIEGSEGFPLDTPTSVNVTEEKQAPCLMTRGKTSSEYVGTICSSSSNADVDLRAGRFILTELKVLSLETTGNIKNGSSGSITNGVDKRDLFWCVTTDSWTQNKNTASTQSSPCTLSWRESNLPIRSKWRSLTKHSANFCPGSTTIGLEARIS